VTDPFNTCGQFVTNCVPFDNSTVPTGLGAPLH
jgi:hypothetical protein